MGNKDDTDFISIDELEETEKELKKAGKNLK